jgi:hypothetical protein
MAFFPPVAGGYGGKPYDHGLIALMVVDGEGAIQEVRERRV